jgi:hypothetical protein
VQRRRRRDGLSATSEEAAGERFDRLESRVVGRLGVLARALLSPCAAYPFPRFRSYNNTEGDHLKIREG